MERLLTSILSPENAPLFVALGIVLFFLVLKALRRAYLAASLKDLGDQLGSKALLAPVSNKIGPVS